MLMQTVEKDAKVFIIVNCISLIVLGHFTQENQKINKTYQRLW